MLLLKISGMSNIHKSFNSEGENTLLVLDLPNFGMKSPTVLDLQKLWTVLRENMTRCMAQNIPKCLWPTKAHEQLLHGHVCGSAQPNNQ